MSDLTAKARRAAEWWRATGQRASYHDCLGWCVTEDGSSWADLTTITDRMMIAFCEDRGWVDQEQDADGVEWYATEEYAAFNECELAVILTGDGFKWKAIPVEESNRRMVSGTAPTRAEARRQAVEAARGTG